MVCSWLTQIIVTSGTLKLHQFMNFSENIYQFIKSYITMRLGRYSQMFSSTLIVILGFYNSQLSVYLNALFNMLKNKSPMSLGRLMYLLYF